MERYSPSRSRGRESIRGPVMTIRRVTAPMLYAHGASGRWLSSLTAAMDEAAAALCRTCWRQGRSREPVRIEQPPRPAR